MSTTVATSEVLNRAADLIEERGWVGRGGQGWTDDAGSPLCIEGAISAAMGTAIYAYGGFTSAPNRCPAGLAVREHLGLGPYVGVSTSRALFAWNDELRLVNGEFVSVRTQAEVVEVLRAAAVIEAAREQKMAEVSA
jgi:hypothetical protein